MPDLRVDREYIVQTLSDLVGINSVNPSLSSAGVGEREIAGYIADALRKLGLEVTTHETEPGRVSVVGVLRGRGYGRALMLNAHSDTVGVEGMGEPFRPRIRDGKLYGRGAYDMKGSLAACLGAVKALLDAEVELKGDLLLAAVADEEYASLGTEEVIERYEVDGAIVTEPTQMQICLAHKGFIWLDVETFGRAAHGSRFEEGIDANMHMGRFLFQLEKLAGELTRREGHPLVGPPSLHAARVEGGTELSMYSARCITQIERRTIPGESEAQVMAEIQAILNKLSEEDSDFQAEAESFFVRQPFEVSPNVRVVKALSQAAEGVLGEIPPYKGETYWMDSALLAEAGIETVILGPVGAGAHALEEWVDLDSLVQLAQILSRAAVLYSQVG